MSDRQRLLILTYIPSPYQVELFNAIEQSQLFSLKVAYLYGNSDTPIAKLWRQSNLCHDYIILDDRIPNYQAIAEEIKSTDLVIFSYYQHPQVKKLIELCSQINKAWCFWGERPGYSRLGWLSTWYRQWKLAQLHNTQVPIWGMGNWAVQQYRREFGDRRQYFNFPYFSDLSRFQRSSSIEPNNARTRIFLYSGALIHRKGVDLLASAFSTLADEFPDVHLHLLGDGELKPYLALKIAKHQHRVKFLGFQPWDKLPIYYQQADILCVPSRHDGWALVIPEGLATGLPVIGTNRTGAALELIKDRQNGWLIPTGNLQALYQAMKQAAMLSDLELASYSEAAINSVSQHSLADGVNRFAQAVQGTLQTFNSNDRVEVLS
jgi:glycosyltransferase involved in cell wall biosynthesis